MRSLPLYSGMLGAFLEQTDLPTSDTQWYHPSLKEACEWLQIHNPYLKAYNSIAQQLLSQNNVSASNIGVWPWATHIQTDTNIPPLHRGDVVVPPYDFPDDTHNEDAHYTRLAIGFLTDTDNKKIPIAFHDPELEALLFPDLFPDGQGYYKHRKILIKPMENIYNRVSWVMIYDFVYIQHGRLVIFAIGKTS